LDHSGLDYYDRYQKAIEEYAVECAIAKVFCSEVLDEVVDHVVQVHGGYGYIAEYPAERYYRDSRIQRIFEGTNEINRILIPTMLFRRSGSGSLDLRGKVSAAQIAVTEGSGELEAKGTFGPEFGLIANLKTLFLVVLGDTGQAGESQEVLLALADMVIGIFALESALLRADKVFATASDKKRTLLKSVVRVAAFEGAARFHLAASRCSAYAVKGARLTTLQKAIPRLCAYPGEGLLEEKQLLAEAAKESGKYIF
jgi:alkylation response protein AidB-like acyl-CoA dehydrogenase